MDYMEAELVGHLFWYRAWKKRSIPIGHLEGDAKKPAPTGYGPP